MTGETSDSQAQPGRHGFGITATGPDNAAAVYVDGHDIADGLAGLTFTMGVGYVPTVTLDLCVLDATEVQDVQAHVLIPDATRDLLTQLGWTPPAEPGAEPTGDIDVTEFLVVHRYRRDQGDWAWLYRCWGDGGCDGFLSLDWSSRDSAEREARAHLAGHPADVTVKEG